MKNAVIKIVFHQKQYILAVYNINGNKDSDDTAKMHKLLSVQKFWKI